MRALLDTNILIHREASRVIRADIGTLFNWLDKLHYEKCVHPASLKEIEKHHDPIVVDTFRVKISSYSVLKTAARETSEIEQIRAKYDQSANDAIDTDLLKEVFARRVDLFITEDKKLHQKAKELGISDRVYSIESFLEKVTAENPELADYRVLAVHQELFGNIDIDDPFFDSFKEDYPDFEGWFERKADTIAYVSKGDDGGVSAFLFVKVEERNEDYSDIEPVLPPKRRLKIGTLKVVSTGFKLGERFLKIIFDNALRFRAQEIYVTIFDRTESQRRLIDLFYEWGFIKHGVKHSKTGDEFVLVRDFTPRVDLQNPQTTYPYFSNKSKKFIVPIHPEYHTELLPDSILKNESPEKYDENRPNRNAISKVYVSHSIERRLKPGDVIVFYRTKDEGKGFYRSVTTTLGIVQKVTNPVRSEAEFISISQKRSVFTNERLSQIWNRNPKWRPFVVNFLYVHSFPTRLNLKRLMELEIIQQAPRGFEQLPDEAFQKLMEHSHADKRLVVD